MTSRSRRVPPTRDQVVGWCVDQFRRRAQSLEMQQLVLECQQAHWPNERILWQFHSSQWGTVTMEASQRFGLDETDHRGLLFDLDAQVHAIRTALPYLLLAQASIETEQEVIDALAKVADDEGWVVWPGPRQAEVRDAAPSAEFNRLGAERVAAIEHLLVPGECVLDHGLTKLGRSIGYLVVTDRKLIHVDERTAVKTLISLDTIKRVKLRTKTLTATARLDTTVGKTIKINGGKIFIPQLCRILDSAA